MFRDLVSKPVRNYLIGGSVLLLVVSILVRIMAQGESTVLQVTRETSMSVAGTMVAWILSLFYILFFAKKEKQAGETEILDGSASTSAFLIDAQTSQYWNHHGHIGRWVRESPLRQFRTRSRDSPEPLTIRLILLDPDNEELCERYAGSRNGRRRRDPSPLTARQVQTEIAATAIAVGITQAEISSIDAIVLVSKVDLPFRLDVSDKHAYITHSDQTAPAVKFDKGSPYYATSAAFFKNLGDANGRQLSLPAKNTPRPDSIDAALVKQMARDLSFKFVDASAESDKIAEDIAKIVRESI